MIILKLQNLSKYYTSQSAVVMGLSDISLSFSAGEFAAITGENGSGKSTLANVIGGMLPYEGGELYVMGQPTSHYNAADWERYRRDMISFISQDYGILPGNTVYENVESALILSGCDRAVSKEKTLAILKQVELLEYARRRASKLSSGQKQRLAIARALAKPSKILIADEPTGNLDRENSDKVIRLLKEASAERLVILITHEFSEVQDCITRHIVLAGGKVVQDEDCQAAPSDDAQAESPEPRSSASAQPASDKKTASYVARLTAKARPVFLAFTLLILVLTSIASFIFIGNFISATDDVPSRIYDAKAFKNGDSRRIVLAKSGRESFSAEELAELSDHKYVTAVEQYGYLCDVNYYYRDGTDYLRYKTKSYGPSYHPVENPDDYQLTDSIEFVESRASFLRSVSQAGTLSAGRMPESFYEVLSSDPAINTGSRITVFIRDKVHWSVSVYLELQIDVVGETEGESGLYFSDSFCRMMNNATLNAIQNNGGSYIYTGGDLGRHPVAPYDAERYADAMEETDPDTKAPISVPETLKDNEFISSVNASPRKKIGDTLKLSIGDGGRAFYASSGEYELVCAGLFNSVHPRFVLVSPETFERMTGSFTSDQVSLTITDYAYTERVIEDMTAKGYVALSPFMQGSTKLDASREAERINLLRISLAAAVLTLVLQLILLKVVFASLNDHYRILSNMGLRAKAAYGSLARIFAILTILSEIIGAAVILLLNHYGYARVVNIFKYLMPTEILLIFAIHFVFCVIAGVIVIRSLKKQVFSVSRYEEDINGELMEEVMGA